MISEAVRKTLEQIEHALKRDALEACVFLLPSGAVIAFALTTMRGHNCRYNIGERPVRNHLRTVLRDETADVVTWFGGLRGAEPPGVPKPATVWHRPHLLITEVMSPERLVTVFEHPEWIRPEVLAEIADEIGVETGDDLEGLFQRAARRQLGSRAIEHFRNVTRPTRYAARRAPEEETPRQAPSSIGRVDPPDKVGAPQPANRPARPAELLEKQHGSPAKRRLPRPTASRR